MSAARIAVPIAMVAGLAYGLLHPVCVPLSDDDLARFTTPIEQREDRDFYLRIFQEHDGQWHQCKTWISRTLFF